MKSDVVVKAESPSEAWKVLNRVVEDENSQRAKNDTRKIFETLAMNVSESAREYVARTKGLL